MAKFKITESQKQLFEALGVRKQIKEQDFINQAQGSNPIGEENPYRERGMQKTDTGKNWYTINVTILSGIDELPDDGTELDDNTYFSMANEDARQKIEEAFKTKEFVIHSISNKSRGEMNPLHLH